MVNGNAATPADTVIASERTAPRISEFKYMVKIFFRRPLAVIGLVILVVLVLTAIFAPLLAPYDPYEMNIVNKLKPPSATHLLGTDSLGRDTLSRIIYGAQTSLVIGLAPLLWRRC